MVSVVYSKINSACLQLQQA